MLVKSSHMSMELEAQTMRFVREHTTIPVPEVHLVFKYEHKTFLVMEYVSGGDLQHLWPSFGESDKRAVLSQVQQYLRELRDIKPASQIPGPLGGGRSHGI